MFLMFGCLSGQLGAPPAVASPHRLREWSISMRRFMSGVGRRHSGHGDRQVTGRDVRAIRHAIEDAPTPGLAADLLAAATRQGIHVFR